VIESPHSISSVSDLIDVALSEDSASNDITTTSLVPEHAKGIAIIKVNSPGVLAGVYVSLEVFLHVDSSLTPTALITDSSTIEPGLQVATIEGKLSSILAAERTALNFIQRMSGIATNTAQYVNAVKGLDTKILDTRKTIPGWRILDKYAVAIGGATNHRISLADGILIKDNHLSAMKIAGLSIHDTVKRALKCAGDDYTVEVEVTNLHEALEAMEAGAHSILLDNMSTEEINRIVSVNNGRVLLEASGGVTLKTVRSIAETGVDAISIGGLTHSSPAIDMSLEL